MLSEIDTDGLVGAAFPTNGQPEKVSDNSQCNHAPREDIEGWR